MEAYFKDHFIYIWRIFIIIILLLFFLPQQIWILNARTYHLKT